MFESAHLKPPPSTHLQFSPVLKTTSTHRCVLEESAAALEGRGEIKCVQRDLQASRGIKLKLPEGQR